MIELGDLVVFTPCQRSSMGIQKFSAFADFRKLRQKVSCGVVIDRFNKNESQVLKIVFPEGSYSMSIDQVTTVSKWYVAVVNKL